MTTPSKTRCIPSPEHGILLVLCVLLLSAWEWAARRGSISPLYFPAPSVLAETLLRMIRTGALLADLLPTLGRLVSGLCLGGLSGLVLGLLMGWSKRLRRVFDPIVAASHPLPKIAVLPLLLIILGIGESAKITAIALAAFFPMLINAMAGVQEIHPAHFELARGYGANRLQIFLRVVLPASLPMVMAGVRLAMNVAWLVTIAVEIVAASSGLGSMIWMARETMHTEEIYAALVVISLIGVCANWVLRQLTLRLIPWQREKLI